MDINLALYKAIIPAIESIVMNNTNLPEDDIISLASVGTGAHIVATTYFLCYIKGHTDVYANKIDRLKQFYHIDNVRGIGDFFYADGRSKKGDQGS